MSIYPTVLIYVTVCQMLFDQDILYTIFFYKQYFLCCCTFIMMFFLYFSPLQKQQMSLAEGGYKKTFMPQTTHIFTNLIYYLTSHPNFCLRTTVAFTCSVTQAKLS